MTLGKTGPAVVVFVQGGTVVVEFSVGATGLDEDGNDCLTGATWDAGAPTIYPALPDVTDPYMGPGARTTLARLGALARGKTLTLTAVPGPKPSDYSPAMTR